MELFQKHIRANLEAASKVVLQKTQVFTNHTDTVLLKYSLLYGGPHKTQ